MARPCARRKGKSCFIAFTSVVARFLPVRRNKRDAALVAIWMEGEGGSRPAGKDTPTSAMGSARWSRWKRRSRSGFPPRLVRR
jgi:hypothetical protein